jgi:D-serine deaminase-like pyridoxal phosphate-dependent protein
MQRTPARPGDPISVVDTPALILDLDAFERNLDAMAQGVAARDVRLRPHAKAHKCPDVAKAQIARGAVGVCCQKTDEAAAFVEAGIADVLVTNEVVSRPKLARLAALARGARIGVLADDASVVPIIGEAARAAGVVLDVYVEVDVGAHRCGIAPGAGAVPLAQAVVSAEGLRFAGIHAYHGGAQHLRTPEERRAAITLAGILALQTRTAIEAAGIACPIVTGAGTGTWPIERDSGVWNELQPGSYPFMDVDYGRNAPAPEDVRFEQSLFVLASVMSVPEPGRAVCDAGLKAFAFDSGLPQVHARPGLVYAKASDEHGVLNVEPGARAPGLGETIRLVPGHVDPTFNLYDWVVGYRGDVVECVWPVSARGAGG